MFVTTMQRQVQHPLDDESVSVTVPQNLSQLAKRERTAQEINAIPSIGMTIRILKFWGYLYQRNWRTYCALVITTIFNILELFYMATIDADMGVIIRSAFVVVLWLDTILRGWQMVLQTKKYEKFLLEFVDLYNEILKCDDDEVVEMLLRTTRFGKNCAIFNMVLGVTASFGFTMYPLLFTEKMLPIDANLLGLDTLQSPTFELLYLLSIIVTPMGCCMYICFGSLIVSLIMFAILMCRFLQHRLRGMTNDSEQIIADKVTWCIRYQKTIIRYVTVINNLTTFVFLVEFIMFGALLCGLLFLVNIAKSTAELVIAICHTTMIFSQLLTLYWFANELYDASILIADAAYDTEWFTFPKSVQKNILLLIMRAQQPCSMTVGNIYPMSLEMFQSLLNASYSYFTILRRFYG